MSKPYEDDSDAKHSTGPDTGPLYTDTGPFRGDTAEERYGGSSFAGAFFGCLVAVAMTVLLAGLVSAGLVGAGVTAAGRVLDVPASQAETVALVSAVAVLVILMIAYFAGGYVAGRMTRFNGGRQGRAVWRLGLLVTILAAAMLAGARYGTQSEVFDQAVHLPAVPIPTITLIAGLVVTFIAVFLGTRMSAVSGGKVGQRYQARIDSAVT
jgi:hypothetical protein